MIQKARTSVVLCDRSKFSRLMPYTFARFSDIDFLKNCPQLTSLSADGNGITDISALAACGKLYSLSLNGNQISNLSALDLCTGLQNLELNENELEDLSGHMQSQVLFQCVTNEACSNRNHLLL